jgi:hypothetical protein
MQTQTKVQIRIIVANREAVKQAVESLKGAFDVVYVSKPYPCRKQKGYRVYITALFKQEDQNTKSILTSYNKSTLVQ